MNIYEYSIWLVYINSGYLAGADHFIFPINQSLYHNALQMDSTRKVFKWHLMVMMMLDICRTDFIWPYLLLLLWCQRGGRMGAGRMIFKAVRNHRLSIANVRYYDDMYLFNLKWSAGCYLAVDSNSKLVMIKWFLLSSFVSPLSQQLNR